MRSTLRFALVACVVGVALPSTAAAQERKGFWYGHPAIYGSPGRHS